MKTSSNRRDFLKKLESGAAFVVGASSFSHKFAYSQATPDEIDWSKTTGTETLLDEGYDHQYRRFYSVYTGTYSKIGALSVKCECACHCACTCTCNCNCSCTDWPGIFNYDTINTSDTTAINNDMATGKSNANIEGIPLFSATYYDYNSLY